MIAFDGRSFAQQKELILQGRILELKSKLKRNPKLVAVGIGNESDIGLYISMKQKVAQRLGVDFENKVFSDDSVENEVLDWVRLKSNDVNVDGILLEFPIPKKFSVTRIMAQISPQKDPDCMTAQNLGNLMLGAQNLMPATVRAVVEILKSIPPDGWNTHAPGGAKLIHPSGGKFLTSKNALVIGGGVELGKPLALVLSDMGASVSLCRSTTRNLLDYTQNADIIISAVGKPGLITGDMVKDGVVVIDCGINFVNGKTQGDVDFNSVSKKASFLTPVPGGVGPVTILSLFENLADTVLT